MNRPFLMISPHFPPSALIGAKRGLTLARNLPRHGWDPAVIALPIDRNAEPALAPLVPDVPIWRGFRSGPIAWFEQATRRRSGMRPAEDTRAAKAGAERPSGLAARVRRELGGLPVDRYLKFQPWVLAGAWRFLRRHRCELIHVSAGPFSGLALAYALAELTGLPLVCDLRDPWAHDPIYSDAWTPTGRAVARAFEAAAFRRAGRVVMNSDAALAHYRAVYAGELPPERFTRIRNHFDPELYAPAPPPPGRGGPFTVVFFGHLTPVRNGALFFEAWRRFIDAERLAPGDATLITLGDRTPTDESAIERLALAPYVETRPFMPFVDAPKLLGAADLLLDIYDPRHLLRISGKLYDYMAARRPVLSISSNPEVIEMVRETGLGRVVPHDVGEIVAALSAALADKRAGTVPAIDPARLQPFEAGPAAAQMAAVFDDVT
ncbi:MAG: glycosyltransferase [Myxococcales bacterium]|nr:glycosyltransferase [Myxococcales bacterium]